MADIMTEVVMVDDLAPKIFEPIFVTDELPRHFAKHLRRPLLQLSVHAFPFHASTRLSFVRDDVDFSHLDASLARDSHDNDDDCNERTLHTIASASRPSIDGAAFPPNFGALTSKGTSGLRIRVKGGRAAVPKRVGADLDSEDEIIKQMKDIGETNSAIANCLIERGGTRYDPKTIATRYARIKRTQFENDEIRRDDEFSDFHEDEDTSLLEAFENTTTFFEKELERLQQERWKKIAAIVQEKIGKPKYSGKACRDRVTNIRDGTAVVPQEQDQDPEQRRQNAATEVARRLLIKSAQLEIARREYNEKLRVKQELDAEDASTFQERFAEESQRAAEREMIRHQKEVQMEARALEKENREALKAAEKQAKVDKKDEAERLRRDAMAARAYEREHAKERRELDTLQERLAKVEATKNFKLAQLQEKQESQLAREIIRRVMRDAGLDTHAPLQANMQIMSNAKALKQVRDLTAYRRKRTASEMAEEDDEDVKLDTPPAKRVAKEDTKGDSSSLAAVSSPRFKMTTLGLSNLLKRRKLPATGSKAELVRRLDLDDLSKSKEQLKQQLTALRASVTGNKADMMKRLAEYDVQSEGL